MSNFALGGKTAVVTGGAGGIGAAVAAAYADAGARVLVADLDLDAAEARTLGVEWAARGVRVNAIAPGIVTTPLIERLAAEGSLDLDDLASRVPSRRTATPADIAGLALLLSSAEGSYLVGQTIVIDGGLSSAGPRDTSIEDG